MSLRYLLDTNILSILARDPRGRIQDVIATKPAASLCTSIVVSCEIRFGFHAGAPERVRRQMEVIMGSLEILPLQPPMDEHYGEIRAHLRSIGQLIGSNDLLIAAQARSLGLVVVTNNTREFSRVPGLLVEDWTVAP